MQKQRVIKKFQMQFLNRIPCILSLLTPLHIAACTVTLVADAVAVIVHV